MPHNSAAQAFKLQYADYFFEDAHHLVEAAASLAAREVAPCLFEFEDGSRLEINKRSHQVLVHLPVCA